MFKVDQHFRGRVHFPHGNGGLSVRIERQNARGMYFWGMCMCTVVFILSAQIIWDAMIQHSDDALYISLILLIGATLYLLAVSYCVWGAFGVEEVSVEQDTLSWKLTALRWSHTRTIPVSQIKTVRAVTPWHGMNNTVEIITDRKCFLLGDRLLRDEAVKLADKLSRSVRCEVP